MKICTKNPCWHMDNMKKLLLVMKITAFLLFVTIMQVSASGFAQKITLSQKDITLKEFFKVVKKQTGFNVSYANRAIRDSRRIDVDFKNIDLESALKQVLEEYDLSFNIYNKDIAVKVAEKTFLDKVLEQFQEIDITAAVVDQKGSPLIGATIRVKGSNRFATSGKDGVFVIKKVDEKDVLVISFIGYKTLEIQADKVTRAVILRSVAENLSEVTVTTAYGIERSKKELGYSVAQVSGEAINKANSGNLLSGLTGKVSGLNIMSQSSEMTPKMRVLLRGIRSFGESSNNQPLFILNGAPLSFGSDGDAGQRAVEFINNLNPADIENVTVLKGANGTAMYGPEGVNGVIIITTKKVKLGETTVNARVNSSYNRFDFRQRIDQRTFGVGDLGNAGVGGAGAGSWGPAYDGKIIPIGYPDKNGEFQKVAYKDLNDRYDFFEVARTTRTNVSISDGDAKSTFYLGLGYVDQTGLLPKDKQNQTTVLFNSGRKLGKKADMQLSVNYARTVSDRGADVTGKVLFTPSFIPLLSYKDYNNSYWGGLDTYWTGVNPYISLDQNRTVVKTDVFSGSFTTNLKVVPWLNLKNQLSINYSGSSSKANSGEFIFSEFARSDPYKNKDLEPTTKDYFSSNFGVNNDLLLSSLHKTGDFLIRGNIGTSVRDNFSKSMYTLATLVVPVYNSVYQRSDKGVGTQEANEISRTISGFANASLGYKDMIFLEATGRNEWDSKRAKKARGKDFYFGANLSFVVKDMIGLLKQQDWLSNFRLRLSATRTANMNIAPQQSERTFNLVYPYPYTNAVTGKSILGFGSLTNPNPFIRPEKVFSQEYGTEMGFLDNRVRLDAAYYHQINNGVIMGVGVPYWSGYPGIDNAGTFRNTGWEFDLNINPLVYFGEDINISLTGRFSINNNEVLSVAEIYNGTFIAKDPQGGGLFYARVGHSAFEFPVTDFKRDPQGRVIVDKNTGMPTVDVQNPKIVGKTLPVYQGGLSLNFQYKRFTLSAQADYSAGNDHAYDPTTIQQGTNALTLMNNREIFVFPNSVIEDVPGHYIENKDVPVSNAGKDLFSRFGNATIHTVSSAAYWKIREIALQYELPLKGKFIKRLTGSVYGRDLFSFYPHSNVYGDPVASQGPGLAVNTVATSGVLRGSSSNNVSGNSSESNAGPGTILYGFTFGLTF